MHGRAYAALLPAPDFRADCKKYENLPIEYLFSDEVLATEVDGSGLEFKRKQASTMLGKEKIAYDLDDVTHFKDISAGKTDFAADVVPTLGAEAFAAFEEVFSLIEGIIAHENQNV